MSTTTFSPIAGRFAWKEYRMLRGFWLAVAALTMLEQWLSTLLAPPGSDVPAWLFASALFAAVLYAVGAAATSFAVEREEETYDYLAGLPTTWPALLVGKLLVTLCSALALAAVLALVGWALGGAPRSATETQQLVGLFGVAIFEAVAWGTLFSLLVKRPLVAAVLTLIVTTAVIHLAVNATVDSPTASIQLRSYSDAIPLRLSIVAGVLLLCTLLARRWLAIGRRRTRGEMASAQLPTASTPRPIDSNLSDRAAGVFSFFHIGSAGAATRFSRRRMFARLLWQTWCESWRLLLLPLLVAIALVAGIAAAASLAIRQDWWQTATIASAALFFPALCGALVFHADQRRRQFRFLAEHAAAPRWVWFARHVVWLGSLAVFSLSLSFLATIFAASLFHRGMVRYISWERWRWESPEATLYNLRWGTHLTLSGMGLVGFGASLAYGIGQLCSLLLRSAIVAAFLALLLSTVATAWMAVTLAWELSGWLFVFPLLVGLLAATWLRAPDWIEERSSWRAWWKPAAAIVAPLVLIGCMLPVARFAQLPARDALSVAEAVEAPDEFDIVEARKTGDMYLKAIDQVEVLDKANIPLVLEASRRPTCSLDFDRSLLQVSATDIENYRYSGIGTWPGMDSKYVALSYVDVTLPENAPAEQAVNYFIAALRMSVHLRQDVPTPVFIHQLGIHARSSKNSPIGHNTIFAPMPN